MGRKRLLWEKDHTPRLSTTITPAEIDHAHADARALSWSNEGKEALEAILRELGKEGWILRFVVVERPVVRSIKYEGNKSMSVSDILDRRSAAEISRQ